MQRTKRTVALGLLIGMLGGTALAQTEQAYRIPSFLQGLPPQRLNSKPVQRFLANWVMRSTDGETIPEPPGARTLAAIRAITAAQTPRPGSGQAPPPGLTYVLNTRWTSVGPQPILNGQIGNVQTNRPMSGRVAALAVHPTDANRWLVGAANGGVWETRNAGATWVALTDAAPTLAVGAMAYAPSNPNIIYVGTGEATFSGSSYGGEGILKSLDGGLNWVQMAANTFVKGTAFSEVRVDPGNANTLVAATTRGIFGRPAQFPPSIGTPGIWRSTDGGATWTNSGVTSDATALSVNAANFNQQYAGTWNAVANNLSDTVRRSTNGGQSWTNVAGPWTSIAANTIRVGVVIAPSNGNRVYVAMENRSTGGLLGLWTSANAFDATPTWTAIALGPTDNGTGTWGPCGFDKAFNSPSGQCWYNMELTVKPTDENLLFFGGIPLWRYNLGTNTWVEVSQTAAPADRNNGIHVDQHASAWAGTRLIIGNDGGVWSTTDDGTIWNQHNSTLAITQYYEGSSSPDASLQLGGSQDNGTQVRSGGLGWPLVYVGDGAGNLLSSNTNWAVSSQNHNIRRTTNAGASFTDVRGNYGGMAPFIGKVKQCAAAAETVALNGSRINVTTTFYTGPASSLWTNSGSEIFSDLTAGSAIAFGNTCNIIVAGHPNGQILMTPPSGSVLTANLRNIDPANQVPNRPIAAFAFPSGNNTTLYVALGGFTNGAPGNIYRTLDFTVASPTWTNVSVPVDGPVNSLLIDPANNNRIFAGTDYGVWLTVDGGVNWSHMGPGIGMPNVPVFDLVTANGRVFAFTHGRSAFVLSNFDLNNDTAVNCADVSIVRAAMGKRLGEAGFNVAADLNSDNIINIRDLTMITRQLPAGTSCP
jgi:hypothetical protein